MRLDKSEARTTKMNVRQESKEEFTKRNFGAL